MMKRTLFMILALSLLLTAGCARAAGGTDVLDPDGIGALPKAPSGYDELAPATTEPSPAPTDKPAPATDAPKTTDAPVVSPTPAKAEPTPAPADKPAAAPKAGELTKADLVTALNGAVHFYGDWFYDLSPMIDPDTKEPAAVVQHKNGTIEIMPVKEGVFATYDELFAAACRHFHEEIADVLLDEVGAQDVDGHLCIGQSVARDDVKYLCELDIEREGDAFDFDLEYAPADTPHADQDVTIQYKLRDGVWAFAGRPSSIDRFFTILQNAQDLTVIYDPD